MLKLTLLLVALLPTAWACNMNVGAYKLHNGRGEMSYMDQEKSALYSEQGVWVSWKLPVPRHWDPKTGQMRNQNPGRVIGKEWSHWNQLSDDNPPMRQPTPEEIKAKNNRVNAPDPYREYLRSRQKKPYNPATDDDLYFLSAGHSPEQGTNLEVGVIRGRPKMPAVYLGAMKRPGFLSQPEDTEENTGPSKAKTGRRTTTAEPEMVDSPGMIMEQAAAGSGSN